MLVNDSLTGLERMTISAARFYGVESSAGVVASPANGRCSAEAPLPDIASRLGARRGQTFCAYGPGDQQILDVLAEACRARAAQLEEADLVLYWPVSREALQRDLPALVERLQPQSDLWIIVPGPGRLDGAGASLPQGEVLALARQAGLIDNRVAFLSEREFGYRFRRALQNGNGH
ncbi:MAG: hypothetical protein RMM58_02540 [Chloroflexota bacterium]|nr:hypothetical protein [Dehalococcoidia bacterium]MDW8252736.1 hypothetical protein [Chloroflexota bacterium]